MPGILSQSLLRRSGAVLAAASTFAVGAAIVLPGSAQAGSEHPVQSAAAPSQETDVSAEYLRAAADDREVGDNAGVDSGGSDDVTLSAGSVVNVNAADGTITVEHRPIPRLYMEPMTMIFHVKDRTLLVGLTAGDKIRFQVAREAGGFVVTRLEHSN